jgi:ubiquinone/menaquinone biosynthesis C-methylase UbiE
MGVYGDHVVPRVVDLCCGTKPLGVLRARTAEALSGDIVEIGFGSGLNLPHLPDAVDRVAAVEPSAVGQRLARRRLAASRVPVEFVGLDGQELPVPDDSFDGGLSTFTLCTIPEVTVALAELRRVLRPGATLCFLEHGRAPEPKVAKRQGRLNAIQRRVAGGCNLDRAIDVLIDDAGFEITRLDAYYMKGPKTHSYFYEGVAVNAG